MTRDLSYGWHRHMFDLTECTISHEIRLERCEDGEYRELDPWSAPIGSRTEEESVAAADAFEAIETMYSFPIGVLYGNGNTISINDFFLIQEREEATSNRQDQNYFNRATIRIYEDNRRVDRSARGWGEVRHLEEGGGIDEGVYVSCGISHDVFSDLERIVTQSNGQVLIEIGIRSWYYQDFDGCIETYVEPRKSVPAELRSVTISRVIKSTDTDRS